MNRILLLSIFALLIGACSSSRPVLRQAQVVDGEKMLLGDVEYQDIIRLFPRWKEEAQQTELDPVLVERLQNIREPVTVTCFLGTWCSDSRHGVPPFMLHVLAAQNPNIHIRLIGVDRSKDDPQHLAPQELVDRVPTFVILRDDMLLGRMVETPQSDNFITDFLTIVETP